MNLLYGFDNGAIFTILEVASILGLSINQVNIIEKEQLINLNSQKKIPS